MYYKAVRYIIGAFLVIFFSACGGGGSSASDTINSLDNKSIQKQGRFSNVEGVVYQTDSGIKGITNNKGEFKYQEGDKITFSVDNLILGTITAKENISILDFNNSERVAQALYGLDEDKEPSNGIDLRYLTNTIEKRVFKKNKKGIDDYKIVVEDIPNNETTLRKYREFLQTHNAMILSANRAVVESTVDSLYKRVKAKVGSFNLNFFNEIFLNNGYSVIDDMTIFGVWMDNYEGSLIQKEFETLRHAKTYEAKIKLAALSQLSYEVDVTYDQFQNDLEATRKRNKILINQIVAAIEYTYSTIDATLSQFQDMRYNLETIKNVGIDNIQLADSVANGELDPTRAILYATMKDCITTDKDNAIKCFSTIGMKLSAEATKGLIQNRYFDDAIDFVFNDIFKDTIDTVIVCDNIKKRAECYNAISKIITKYSVKLGVFIGEKDFEYRHEAAAIAYKAAEYMFSALAVSGMRSDHLLDSDTIKDYFQRYSNEVCMTIDGIKSSQDGIGESQEYKACLDAVAAEQPYRAILDLLRNVVLNQMGEDLSIINYYNYNIDDWIEANLNKFLTRYKELYYGFYNDYIQYKNQDNLLINTSAVQSTVESLSRVTLSNQIQIIKNQDNSFYMLIPVKFESSIENIVIDSVALQVSGEHIEETPLHYDGVTPISKNMLFKGLIELKNLPNKDLFDEPLLIQGNIKFHIANDAQKSYVKRIEKLYVAKFEELAKPTVSIEYKYKNGHYRLYANVENNRVGEALQRYKYQWIVGSKNCQQEYSTYEGKLLYTIPSRCRGEKNYASVKVFYNLGGEFVAKKENVYLDRIMLDDKNIKIIAQEELGRANDILEITPKIVGGIGDLKVSFELGEYLEKIESNATTIWVKLLNPKKEFFTSSITVNVEDEVGNSDTKTIDLTILGIPENKGVISFIPNREKPKDYESVQGRFTKEWVIKNISSETLKGVHLKWSLNSYSSLEHKKYIEVGDIEPNEEIVIPLEITVPLEGAVGENRGKFTIWYQDEYGNEKPLHYPSGIEAYVSYIFIVEDSINKLEDAIKINSYNIERGKSITINQKEYQKYLMHISLNQSPKELILISDHKNIYYLVKNGTIQVKPNFINSIESSADKTEWEISFEIAKTDFIQNKSFELKVVDTKGNEDKKVKSYLVPATPVKSATPIAIEQYEINKVSDKEEYEVYQIHFVLNKTPNMVALESDSKRRYELLPENGIINYTPGEAFTKVEVSNDQREWRLEFKVYKSSSIQNKFFKLIVKDKEGEIKSDVRKYSVAKIEAMDIDLYYITMVADYSDYQLFQIKAKITRRPKYFLLTSNKGTTYMFISKGNLVHKIKRKDENSFVDTDASFGGVFSSVNFTNDNKEATLVFKVYKIDTAQSKYFKLGVQDFDGNYQVKQYNYTVPAKK